LRIGVCHNRRPARAQAAFVAVLYVFLSTFGTLTHTHFTLASASARQVSSSQQEALCDQVCAPNVPCAYCEWQASSVSAALPLYRVASVVTPRALVPAPLNGSLHSAFLPGFSSRAPPSA